MRNNLLDETCRRRHESGEDMVISVDGRWSSRRQAMEGTVTCFEVGTNDIIDVQHIGNRLLNASAVTPLEDLSVELMRAINVIYSQSRTGSSTSKKLPSAMETAV